VTVPAGQFTQQTSDGAAFLHSLDAFQIGVYEVAYEVWYKVQVWAMTNGYNFANLGRQAGTATGGTVPVEATKSVPVFYVNWRDAIVWCNAFSELVGLSPVYYADPGFTTLLRDSCYANAVQCDAACARWEASGYRLPTEAEWQYAASYIDGNAWTSYQFVSGAGSTDEAEINRLAWTWLNAVNELRPVGQLDANALGLHDMSGNLSEWCWDWKGDLPATAQANYRGPATGTERIHRGGGHIRPPEDAQVGYRCFLGPGFGGNNIGFRLARK